MRLDHIAYRTIDRDKTVKFFKEAFGYKEQAEFDIKLEDGSTARCKALEPPEKVLPGLEFSMGYMAPCHFMSQGTMPVEYHMAPEIFVSDGPEDTLIHKWVMQWTGGRGGVHHMAYQVPSVKDTMKLWLDRGWAEFLSAAPLSCDDLDQVFTKPCKYTGMIYEFIERKGQHGFCKDNVAKLMGSTASLLE
jgi:catechol 2,3-dioxygenase-like lactoylglutathione lyase family enzyme